MIHIERDGRLITRHLSGPRRLSDVLSREEYTAVLRGELAPFSKLGGGMDLSSRVEEGTTIVLRTMREPLCFGPLTTLELSGPLDAAKNFFFPAVEPTESKLQRLEVWADSLRTQLAEQTATTALTERALAETPAPAWLVDLVEQGRADALQADRAKLAGSCEPWTGTPAIPWTSGKRWFHHREMPQGFDAAAHEAAVRLLGKMASPLPPMIVISPLPLTAAERRSLAVLADAYRWNGSTLPEVVSAVETVSGMSGRRTS